MPVLFVVFFAVLVNFSPSLLAQEDNVQIRGPRGTDTLAQQTTIGPLSANDTLWRVAERLRPNANVSLYQVMYALYQKNPEAFLEQNLNHLRPNAVLIVPTLREIKLVDIALAKQKSEQDDQVWQQRQQTAKAAVTAAKEAKQQQAVTVQTAAPVDDKWQKTLQQETQQQRDQLADMRSQFNNSFQQVQNLNAENQQLKASLTLIETELENLKNQFNQDNELQQQLTSVLAQQAELLRANAEIEAKMNNGFNWQEALKSPLAWVLAASIPALLVLFSVLVFIKRRGKQTEAAVNAAQLADKPDPSYQSPLPPLDDYDDIDESLFDLDDGLLDDAFADEKPSTKAFENAALAINIDDDLLDFDDELLLDDESLLLDTQENIQQTLGNESDPFDPDQILSDTDISALLMAEDDDDSIDLADTDASIEEPFDPDQILSDTDVAALLMAEDDYDEDIIELADVDAEAGADEFDLSNEYDLSSDIDEVIKPEVVDELTVAENILNTESDIAVKLPELSAAEDELSLLEQSLAEQLHAESIASALSDADLIHQAFAEEDNANAANVNNDDVTAINIAAEDSLVKAADPKHNRLTSSIDDSLSDSLNKPLNDAQDEILAGPTDEVLTDDSDYISDVEPEYQEQPYEEEQQEFAFDSSHLEEFSDSLAQEQAPDLSTSDDGSVSKVTDASLSVENPSAMLAQYPALDLTEEDLSLDIESLTPPVLSDEAFEQLGYEAIELDPLAGQQFDSLMGELDAIASNVELNQTESTEFELEHADIGAFELEKNTDFDFNDDDFVEIDKLLASTEQQNMDPERFNRLNVDVGLDDFADVIGKVQAHDVDLDDNGYAAKLDLARAYIEMADDESAEQILDDILQSDAAEHVKIEAETLKSQL